MRNSKYQVSNSKAWVPANGMLSHKGSEGFSQRDSHGALEDPMGGRRGAFQVKIFLIVVILSLTGCEGLVQVPPPDTETVRSTVFADDRTALSAMTSVYIKLAGSSFTDGGPGSLTILEGAYGDELISYASVTSSITPFYFNSVDPQNPSVSSIWNTSYNMIYLSNAVIEGLAGSTGVTPGVRDQLTGEALFVRAFIHFYLANLFGDVPYIQTTSFEDNAKVSRTPAAQVYTSIIADLLEAQERLTDSYPSGQRVRPNKGAATALLARAFLYNGDWAEAETQATEIITNTPQYTLLDSLGSVFLKNSDEAIWQLIPQFGYTREGAIFILLAPPSQVALRSEVAQAFEAGDRRREQWVDSLSSTSGLTTWYYPFKYKEKPINATGAEYSMVLRLAEQFLIRAEARAQQGKLTGANSAASDINAIRSRAGLPNTTAATQQELLEAIIHERRVELFTEWGHRFFDLKRWGMLDEVLDPLKPNWETTDALLPLPQSELLINSNLTQNPGY